MAPPLASLAAACALLCAFAAQAQSGAPVFTAPPGSLQAEPPDDAAEVDALELAQQAVELYAQTCAAGASQAGSLIDRALAAGLQPYAAEGGTPAHVLLGGAPGQVYAQPGRAALLQLALGDDGRCTVWAQQAEGPGVKAGFLSLIDGLRGQGARVRATHDRVVERGGGWRQQTGFEVRDAGGTRSFDAVTLLIERPGLQVLSTGPIGAAAAAPAAR